jgi:rhodanese-related sulfurtransferase
MIQAIDVEILAQLRRHGSAGIVVDIRELPERQICAIPESLNLPMQEVSQRLPQLPRDRPLVILCHHGVGSAVATTYLPQHGFANAYNLTGGIDAWARRIDSDMARY